MHYEIHKNYVTKLFGTHSEREVKLVLPIVDKIEALEPEYEKLLDEDFLMNQKHEKRIAALSCPQLLFLST